MCVCVSILFVWFDLLKRRAKSLHFKRRYLSWVMQILWHLPMNYGYRSIAFYRMTLYLSLFLSVSLFFLPIDLHLYSYFDHINIFSCSHSLTLSKW